MPVKTRAPAPVPLYAVQLPAGGTLHLQSPDEVELWQNAQAQYQAQYVFLKHNDLVTLGALLQQQVVLFRCQTSINGMVPELDSGDVPTGRYRRMTLDGADLAGYQRALTEAAKEMRALEKQLGIDKATREAGGTHTVDSYISTLKRAAHQRGIHIVKRTLKYEEFVNELSWRMRMLLKSDAEDKAYHNISAKTVLQWVYEELQKLEQIDKDYSREKGRLYLGKL